MVNKLNQAAPIFWKGNLCKFIKWDTLNFGGKLKIKIDKKFIEVDITELTNIVTIEELKNKLKRLKENDK